MALGPLAWQDAAQAAAGTWDFIQWGAPGPGPGSIPPCPRAASPRPPAVVSWGPSVTLETLTGRLERRTLNGNGRDPTRLTPEPGPS